jgi:hypothetical protein
MQETTTKNDKRSLNKSKAALTFIQTPDFSSTETSISA